MKLKSPYLCSPIQQQNLKRENEVEKFFERMIQAKSER